LKRKIQANKGKNSHFQFGYQQDWAFINESSVRLENEEARNFKALGVGEWRDKFLEEEQDRNNWQREQKYIACFKEMKRDYLGFILKIEQLGVGVVK